MQARDGGPLTVIDLGAGSGTTALAVLDEHAEAQITTVDISRSAVDWAEQAVRNCYAEANWIGVVADAGDVARMWPDGAVDLLLHDASHEYPAVADDLRAWLPKLAPHALIWVHDFSPPPQTWGQPDSPGVALSIRDLVSEGMIVEVERAGLGWVGRLA